jgi:DNA polymerase III sliding clamp (beta) subunit (PCNA family)
MKIALDQETLIKALEKGGFAALADVAQNDNSNMSLLVKSVKITTDEDNVIIESSNPVFSSKTQIPAQKEAGVAVEERGSILVDAKSLVGWIKAQGKGSTVKLALSELDTHETLSFDDETDETKTFSITRIGTVKILSKDDHKTVGKWEIDCYDPTQGNIVDYSSEEKSAKMFGVAGSELETALGSIKFSAWLQDTSMNLENVSIQNNNGSVYFATTDKKRCSLYNLETVIDIESSDPLLVSVEVISQISKIFDKEQNVEIHYNKEKSKIFLTQDSIETRISCADQETIKNYPNVALLVNQNYKKLGVISKKSFNKMLSTVSLVNNHTALYTFKDGKLKLHALSEKSVCKPSVTEAPIDELSEDVVAVISVKHFKEFLKQVKSEDIILNISDNKKSLTATGTTETNFIYFVMSTTNSLYDPLLSEAEANSANSEDV